MLKETINELESAVDTLKSKVSKSFGPVRPVRVEGYAGYGHGGRVWLGGRVLAHLEPEPTREQGGLKNALDMLRRYESDEVPGASLILRCQDQSHALTSDDEGYFSRELREITTSSPEQFWQTAQVELLDPLSDIDAQERFFEIVYQMPQRANLAVISDIDDTIIRTGADNILKHTKTVLLNNPYTREVFPGMAALLTGLTHDDDQRINPLFFLSSSPWNLYSLFEKTFEVNGIPKGTFFLKDFGVDEQKFIKDGHDKHKTEHIVSLLDRYPDLTFILIGDSGQRDAEIYAGILRKYSHRIKACYIRDVTDGPRDEEVIELTQYIERITNVPMRLVEHSVEIAEHAMQLGLLSEAQMRAVLAS